MDSITTDALVDLLVAHWHARVEDLPRYLQTQFHYRLERPVSFDRLVIHQIADGDIATRSIGRDGLSKWVYEAGRLHPVPLDHAWQGMYKTDQADELFLAPVFVFFSDGHQLLLSERFGPSLTHRLLGDIRSEANKLVVGWTTIWCSTTR